MLTASILTMLIPPGLAFYYAGRCQSKNVIIFSSLELSNANCSFVLSTPANIFHPDQAVGGAPYLFESIFYFEYLSYEPCLKVSLHTALSL